MMNSLIWILRYVVFFHILMENLYFATSDRLNNTVKCSPASELLSGCVCSEKADGLSIQIKCENIMISFYSNKTLLDIECFKSDVINYQHLPQLSFGNFTSLAVNGCPLTPTDNEQFIKKLGVDVDCITDLALRDINATLSTDLSQSFFALMRNLKSISIESSRLENLANGLFDNNERLEAIHLNHNLLSSIESGYFKNLQHLRKLNLTNNNLLNFTNDLFGSNSSGIESVDLSQNGMQIIGENVFANLPCLEVVLLQGNNFSTLPNNLFSNNPRLRQFELYDNRKQFQQFFPEIIFASTNNLTEIILTTGASFVTENLFKNASTLSSISLTNNEIVDVPKNLFHGKEKLTVLQLSHNLINNLDDDVFESVSNLKELDLSFNHIVNITASLFVSLVNLKKLKLNNNNIHHITPGAFRNQYQLTQLYIYNNNLHILEGVHRSQSHLLPNNTALEVLDASHNAIESVCFTFELFPNLRVLNLSDNSISHFACDELNCGIQSTCLDANLTQTEQNNASYSLEAFSIANNRLHCLERSLFQILRGANDIRLSNNQWTCNFIRDTIDPFFANNPDQLSNNSFAIDCAKESKTDFKGTTILFGSVLILNFVVLIVIACMKYNIRLPGSRQNRNGEEQSLIESDYKLIALTNDCVENPLSEM